MHSSAAVSSPAILLAPSPATPRPKLYTWQVADRASHISGSVLRTLAAACDLISVAVLGAAAGMVLPLVDGLEAGLDWPRILASALLTAVATTFLGLGGKQALLAPPASVGSRLALALLLAFSALAATFSLTSGNELLPRPALAVWICAAALGLLAARAMLGTLVRHWAAQGRLERRVAIYGTGQLSIDLITSLEADPSCDVRIVGVCDDRDSSRSGDDVMGYPRIGTIDDLVGLARRSRIDTIIVTVPAAAQTRLLQIFERLAVLPAEVRQPAAASPLQLAPSAYSQIGRLPMLSILDRPIGGWGLLAKAAVDRAVAALALIVLSPVLAAVAIAVKLDSPGPVLFRQKRYGFNNELIEILKFRSMFTEQSDAKADRLVTRGDSRVTAVGRFIRRTSLDELPQLINVLLGSLSLVGPRPHAVNAKAGDRLYGDVVGRYFVRHKVKPGITGWAQVNGWRGETDTEEKIVQRVAHDLYYIENWSLLLDLRILLHTPLTLLKMDNAY